MAYDKHTYAKGDVLEASDLNHGETGIDTNDENITSLQGAVGTLTNLTTDAKTSLVAAINEVDSHANSANNNAGTLSNLTTDAKNNLVAAINEVDGHADSAATAIGDMTDLETTATDLVGAANELKDKLDTLPDPAQGDGTYVIIQTNGDMVLSPANIGDVTELTTEDKSNVVSAINEVDSGLKALNDQLVLSSLDGTKAKYDAMMKQWFLGNGVNVMTPEGITALCERWYTITRNGWDGYTEFALPSESAVSTGTKGGDNTGLTCVPSTDVAANTDDYAGNPLFACVDVNYVVDATTLDIVITAIDGITENFVRNDPTKFVGVMQMSGWHYYYDTATTYVHGYADHQVETGTCEPLPESVRVDGTIRPFVVHSKYMSKTVDGKLTSCAGLVPTAYSVSHNSLHSLSAATGSQYSGGTIVDNSFLILMAYIKYASLTLDEILQGCCAYNFQYYAKVAETGVRRVIVAQSQGANIKVGSSLIIGNYGGNADRNQGAMYSISGQAGCVVTAVEDVTINGTTYKAIYVDTASTFNTVVNGDATNGTTVISTFHWKTGTCDSVLGNDGSPGSASNGQYPAKLQGIEYAVGAYEVYADVILNLAAESGTTYYTPYVVKRSAKQSTGITSDYTALSALKIACPSTEGWNYIKREGFSDGVFSPVSVGGSSSTYTRDAMYMNKQGTTGTREWQAFGSLASGSGSAGLSSLYGNDVLGLAWWFISARLSPNGNRGEWTA